MANYPRELFECEKQAKEQIPLLFGLSKHNSGTSVGSDQVEAAPTSSNRTETTHSTAISDESNVSVDIFQTLFIYFRQFRTATNNKWWHCILRTERIPLPTMNPRRRRPRQSSRRQTHVYNLLWAMIATTLIMSSDYSLCRSYENSVFILQKQKTTFLWLNDIVH